MASASASIEKKPKAKTAKKAGNRAFSYEDVETRKRATVFATLIRYRNLLNDYNPPEEPLPVLCEATLIKAAARWLGVTLTEEGESLERLLHDMLKHGFLKLEVNAAKLLEKPWMDFLAPGQCGREALDAYRHNQAMEYFRETQDVRFSVFPEEDILMESLAKRLFEAIMDNPKRRVMLYYGRTLEKLIRHLKIPSNKKKEWEDYVSRHVGMGIAYPSVGDFKTHFSRKLEELSTTESNALACSLNKALGFNETFILNIPAMAPKHLGKAMIETVYRQSEEYREVFAPENLDKVGTILFSVGSVNRAHGCGEPSGFFKEFGVFDKDCLSQLNEAYAELFGFYYDAQGNNLDGGALGNVYGRYIGLRKRDAFHVAGNYRTACRQAAKRRGQGMGVVCVLTNPDKVYSLFVALRKKKDQLTGTGFRPLPFMNKVFLTSECMDKLMEIPEVRSDFEKYAAASKADSRDAGNPDLDYGEDHPFIV
jgi:hypothetical protein